MPIVGSYDFTSQGRRQFTTLPTDVQEAIEEALGNRVGEDHAVGMHTEEVRIDGDAYVVVGFVDEPEPGQRAVYWVTSASKG